MTPSVNPTDFAPFAPKPVGNPHTNQAEGGPHFDPEAELTLQIRDRLRDLLEADIDIRLFYPIPLPIRRLATDDLPAADVYRASLQIAEEDFGVAATQTHDNDPRFLLTIQRYSPNTADVSQEDAFDDLVTVTSRFRKALLKYQSDPSDFYPGQGCRLWDSLRFDRPRTTVYNKLPGKFWYSTTLFQVNSYQHNSCV